jgi:hypothetical protein
MNLNWKNKIIFKREQPTNWASKRIQFLLTRIFLSLGIKIGKIYLLSII